LHCFQHQSTSSLALFTQQTEPNLTLQQYVPIHMNFLHMIICSLPQFTESTVLLIFKRDDKTEQNLSVCNVAKETGNKSNYTCELEFQEPLLLCL